MLLSRRAVPRELVLVHLRLFVARVARTVVQEAVDAVIQRLPHRGIDAHGALVEVGLVGKMGVTFRKLLGYAVVLIRPRSTRRHYLLGLGLVLCDPNVCDLALAGVVRRLSVHEQAGGVFSDGWELELWRTSGED